MDPRWIIDGSSLDHRWIIVGSSLDHRWIIVGSSMDHRWIIVGSSMDHEIFWYKSVNNKYSRVKIFFVKVNSWCKSQLFSVNNFGLNFVIMGWTSDFGLKTKFWVELRDSGLSIKILGWRIQFWVELHNFGLRIKILGCNPKFWVTTQNSGLQPEILGYKGVWQTPKFDFTRLWVRVKVLKFTGFGFACGFFTWINPIKFWRVSGF